MEPLYGKLGPSDLRGTQGYRTLAVVDPQIAEVEKFPKFPEHPTIKVGEGSMITPCKQPGFWARIRHGINYGHDWQCFCGRIWRFRAGWWELDKDRK